MPMAESKRAMLIAVVQQATDEVVRAMAMMDDSPSMSEVRNLAHDEWCERRRRDLVFAPIVQSYGATLRGKLWRTTKAVRPELIKAAVDAKIDSDDPVDMVFDEICLTISNGLRGGKAEWSPAIQACHAAKVEPETVASALALAQVVRSAQARIGDWAQRMTEERTAAVRLAYRDAVTVSPDAGPLFFEMLEKSLDEPWAILRIISAAMNGPTEAYMAGSELARMAQAALEDIGACIDYVRRFDAADGASAGPAAAAQAQRAATGIVEFAAAIRLSDNGQWGRQISAYRKSLAAVVEGRLKEIEGLIEKALPRSSRGRKRGASPDYSGLPDSAAAARAAAMVAFADALHGCADFGGFGAMRTKVLSALEDELHSYVEETLDVVRKGGEETQIFAARRYLEIAADIYGLVKGDKAAEVIRRRAAA